MTEENATGAISAQIYQIIGLRELIDKAFPPANSSREVGELMLAMTTALAMVEPIKPAGHNTFHKYRYLTIGQVVDAARNAFSAAGVAFVPTVRNVQVSRDTYPDDNGRAKMQTYCLVELELRFYYGEQWIATHWRGEGIDNGDKAYNKAYSAALKQGLMKTLLIGDEEDADGDSPERLAPQKTTSGRPKQNERPKVGPDRPMRNSRSSAPDDDGAELANLIKKFHALIGAGELADTFKDAIKDRWGIESIKDADVRKLGALCDALASKAHTGDGVTERGAYMAGLLAEWSPDDNEPESQERQPTVGGPCEFCGESIDDPEHHGDGICAPPDECPLCGGDPLIGGHGIGICGTDDNAEGGE